MNEAEDVPEEITQETTMSNTFNYNRFVSNETTANYGDQNIHLGFGSGNRLREAKRFFNRNLLPSRSMNLFCGIERTAKKYTEDIRRVTCPQCRTRADQMGWGAANPSPITYHAVVEASGSPSSTLLHRDSISNVVKWMPKDCSIVISDGKIVVKDEKINNETEVKTLREACILIVESFFEPFDGETILSNTSLFSKTLLNNSNKKLTIQGFKYDSSTQKINGLIVKSSSNGRNQNNLEEVTFLDLFHEYHFSNGSPCGKYVENRSPRVVEQQTGISVSDIDMSMIGMVDD
jgi:hypothetical protein